MPSKRPRLKKHALVGQTTAFKINMLAGNKFAAIVLYKSFQVKQSGLTSDYVEAFPHSFFYPISLLPRLSDSQVITFRQNSALLFHLKEQNPKTSRYVTLGSSFFSSGYYRGLLRFYRNLRSICWDCKSPFFHFYSAFYSHFAFWSQTLW